MKKTSRDIWSECNSRKICGQLWQSWQNNSLVETQMLENKNATSGIISIHRAVVQFTKDLFRNGRNTQFVRILMGWTEKNSYLPKNHSWKYSWFNIMFNSESKSVIWSTTFISGVHWWSPPHKNFQEMNSVEVCRPFLKRSLTAHNFGAFRLGVAQLSLKWEFYG